MRFSQGLQCTALPVSYGPLLFNIQLCDRFYFLEDLDIASYADDTTIYTVKENKEHHHCHFSYGSIATL